MSTWGQMAGTAGTAGSSAAVVGLDGGAGYPAYSGLLPSPMVTSSLITTRESSLDADAIPPLFDNYAPMPGPFLAASPPTDKPRRKVMALQASARGALVEMELLRGIDIAADTAGVTLKFASKADPIASIGRLDDAVFNQQLQLVAAFAALRAERTSEILTQVVPQTANWSSVAGLSPDRHRFTWELLGVGLRFAMMVTMRLKYEFDVKRPADLSPAIQPMILTPGYTAYPSGHATEAYFVAELLPLLMGDPTHPCTPDPADPKAPKPKDRKDGIARQLNRLAFRIAENRVVAGLHYPVDAIAGQVLGVMLARYVVWLTQDALPNIDKSKLTFGATAFSTPKDVKPTEDGPTFDRFVHEQKHVAPGATARPASVPDAAVLRDLWRAARREWEGD